MYIFLNPLIFTHVLLLQLYDLEQIPYNLGSQLSYCILISFFFQDETRTPTSREVRRIERSEHQNLPKRSPLTEPNGIDPLHEHIGSDNEFDVVGDLNAGGPGGLGSPIAGPLEPNGKFSMLQFAVFNFRESLEKYDVLRDRENHSIRGSIKMLELLKQQNKQVRPIRNCRYIWTEAAGADLRILSLRKRV